MTLGEVAVAQPRPQACVLRTSEAVLALLTSSEPFSSTAQKADKGFNQTGLFRGVLVLEN